MKEFVTGQIEKEHAQRFSKVISLQEKRDISSPLDPFKDEWETLLPMEQYGDVTLPSANSDFITSYKNALALGNFEEFKSQIPDNDFTGIYRVKSATAATDKDKAAVKNYSQESISELEERLQKFLEKVERSDITPAYKAEYRKRIQNGEMQHLKMAKNLGTIDYTVEQRKSADWSNLVDLSKTLQQKTMILPLEDLARKLLIKSRDTKAQPVRSMKSALDFWELSDAEKKK